MTGNELNPLYQQVGEVLSGLRALQEAIELRHGHVEKLYDLVRADLATLRQDQHDLEEKLDCVVCVMQHDLEQLRLGAASTCRSVDDLVCVVHALRRPVSDMIALRSRAAGIVVCLCVIGSAALWLTEPVYRWLVERVWLR
jgi:hypothetical protein